MAPDDDDSTLDDADEGVSGRRTLELPKGARLDRYRERQPLGQGGMGEVVVVHDSLIGRDVALKQLRKDSVKARRRFAREARVQGQLEHPAVVPVYDLGETAEGLPYFTMKWVRGASLRSVLRSPAGDKESTVKLSRRRLLSAFSQVCLAVHYAHERGIVHRDIKPENIMLGDYGEVYLLDWGVAKVVGAGDDDVPEEAAETQVLTKAGELLGSVGYMAPEQAGGDREVVDQRADVYALGAVLFEILTDERLHPPAAVPTMIRRIVEGVDARASVRAPHREVPPELEAICVAATQRDPADRLPSARALHDAIERFLDGDRDTELRRASAQRHAQEATAAAEVALSVSTAEEEGVHRAEALRAIGQTLAFDPSHPDALHTLVRLLTRAPRVVPPEVERDRRDTLQANIRRAALLGAFVYFYILCNVFILYSNTIKSWSGFLPAQILWVTAVLASAATVWRPRYAGLYAMLGLGVAATVETTRILSPFLIVPGILGAHAVIFSLMDDWRRRAVVLGVVALGWTVSWFGTALGLFPPTWAATSGGIMLDSPVVDLSRVFTPGLTWLSFLAMIVLPAFVVGEMRASYARADLRLRLQGWQLDRLLAPARDRRR